MIVLLFLFSLSLSLSFSLADAALVLRRSVVPANSRLPNTAGNVRTARHVIYPSIVNFPNIITSLGIIRIPSGLVIVERRLSAVDHCTFDVFVFRRWQDAGDAETGDTYWLACIGALSSAATASRYPRRYLSRCDARREEASACIIYFGSGEGGKKGDSGGRVH